MYVSIFQRFEQYVAVTNNIQLFLVITISILQEDERTAVLELTDAWRLSDRAQERGMAAWNVLQQHLPINFFSSPKFCPIDKIGMTLSKMADWVALPLVFLYVWRAVQPQVREEDRAESKRYQIWQLIGNLIRITRMMLKPDPPVDAISRQIWLDTLQEQIDSFLRSYYQLAPSFQWSEMIHLLKHIPLQLKLFGSLRATWTFDMER